MNRWKALVKFLDQIDTEGLLRLLCVIMAHPEWVHCGPGYLGRRSLAPELIALPDPARRKALARIRDKSYPAHAPIIDGFQAGIVLSAAESGRGNRSSSMDLQEAGVNGLKLVVHGILKQRGVI